jgi:hypothetical protein
MSDSVKKAVLIILWTGVLMVMHQFGFSSLEEKKLQLQTELNTVETAIMKARRQIAAARRAEAARPKMEAELAWFENTLLPQDAYFGLVQHVEELKDGIDLDLFVDPPSPPAYAAAYHPVYQTLSFNLTGRGHFYDVGTFVAALENSLPMGTIQSFSLKPIGELPENPRVSVQLEIVAPAHSSGPSKEPVALARK